MNKIKIILTDIDGVWTDGGMYYDQTGNEWKRFNTSDGVGVLLAHKAGIKVGIITGEKTNIVENRANKLHVDFLFQGVANKLDVLNQICEQYEISREEVAYIGDDINDICILDSLTCTAVPSGVPDYVKKHAKVVLTKKGGEGVFREFVEYIFTNINNINIYDIL
jgi:3-deoxy-D-glycero-D-galacto-nononate 9-phosphatase